MSWPSDAISGVRAQNLDWLSQKCRKISEEFRQKISRNSEEFRQLGRNLGENYIKLRGNIE
jgi:hypothetical protein